MVAGTYTQRFKHRHQVRGQIFQGRYMAISVDGQEGNYFEVVSTYIHLNPARAGLIAAGQERLKRYRWSSYPGYLNRVGKRPPWLSVDRVLGSLRLRPEDVQGYEIYLEGWVLELASKPGRQELEQEWKRLRGEWGILKVSAADRTLLHFTFSGWRGTIQGHHLLSATG